MTAILSLGVYMSIINSYRFQNCSVVFKCVYLNRDEQKMCFSLKYIQIFIFVSLDQLLVSQNMCVLRFFAVSLLV